MSTNAKYDDNISQIAQKWKGAQLEKFKKAKRFIFQTRNEDYNESRDLFSNTKFDSELRGFDFDKELRIVNKKEFYAWVRETDIEFDLKGNPINVKKTSLGSYFTTESADPDKLGINPKGRIQFKITLDEEIEVLESYTVDIKAWDADNLFYKGGEIQYFNGSIKNRKFTSKFIRKYE